MAKVGIQQHQIGHDEGDKVKNAKNDTFKAKERSSSLKSLKPFELYIFLMLLAPP
jgi:hypothetical protein